MLKTTAQAATEATLTAGGHFANTGSALVAAGKAASRSVNRAGARQVEVSNTARCLILL